MTSIALLGAGGKMGHRLARNLRSSRFDVRHVEVSDAGRARLRDDFNIECVSAETAIRGAEVVILAVPDTAIGKVARATGASKTASTGFSMASSTTLSCA